MSLQSALLSFCRPNPRLLIFNIAITRPRLSSARGPTNKHFSVDAEGKQVFDLHFASEPLGMPASQTYGFVQLDFSERIGPNARYTIVRKLGWGMHSSTWLARDEQ